MNRSRTALALGTTVLALSTAGMIVPAAASADDTAAVIRSAHFSPDTAGVDVYLSPFSGGQTQIWVSDEEYGGISQYRRITPGAYVVSMRPHGAPATSAPAVTWTITASAGAAYTAAAVGTNKALQAVVLTDDLSAPPANQGRVRIVQAASTAATVSVVANGGIPLASNLAFGSTSNYTTVPVGTWTVRVTPAGGGTPVDGSVTVPAGSSSTVAVLDKPGGGLNVLAVQDAASTGVAPAGSVDAGAGGTATVFAGSPSSSDNGIVWFAGAALLVVVAGAAGTMVVRRSRG